MGWQYSEKTKRLFMDAVQGKTGTHVGEIENADGVGEHGSVACGDALKFSFRVERNSADPTQDQIVEAKFLTFGCTSAIAASEALCRIVEERRATPIDALKITNRDIVEFLEGLPSQKVHCSVMGAEALEAAVFDWASRRGVDLAALGVKRSGNDENEGRLVCKCFGLTEPYLRRKIKELNLKTVDDVTGALKAGGACGACRNAPGGIQDILNDVWNGGSCCETSRQAVENAENVDATFENGAEKRSEKDVVKRSKSELDGALEVVSNGVASTGFVPLATVSTTANGEIAQNQTFEAPAEARTTPAEFAKMSPYQKAKQIERTVDALIRPILQRDGGDLEIVDVKDKLVYVVLTGACDGCESASQTLELLVATVLQDQLDPEIRVIPL